MIFYLGTHETSWLGRLTDVPLFVSRRRLALRASMPVATTDWALDSGGFTELSMFGGWETPPAEYVADVRRYRDEIGRLQWASPQDWMCEPAMLARTGLTVGEHQRRTIRNYLQLRDMAPDLPFVPVLQGWVLDDYRRHVDAYLEAGVDLQGEATVGVGSVCKRQRTGQIEQILAALASGGLRLHGFGLKISGLRAGAHHLVSADSMAWSSRGRRVRPATCGSTTHQSEANCLTFALGWRDQVGQVVREPKQLGLALYGGAA